MQCQYIILTLHAYWMDALEIVPKTSVIDPRAAISMLSITGKDLVDIFTGIMAIPTLKKCVKKYCKKNVFENF